MSKHRSPQPEAGCSGLAAVGGPLDVACGCGCGGRVLESDGLGLARAASLMGKLLNFALHSSPVIAGKCSCPI